MQTIGSTRLEVVRGSIVEQAMDAIVNAANTWLQAGGGVDGAIHNAAGYKLQDFCDTLGGCEVGDAKIAPGFNLIAQHVILTVGPIYRGQPEDARLLASAYRRSLEVAEANGIQTIAFPAISTGAYSYPLDEASSIAVQTVAEYVQAGTAITMIRFVMWTTDAYEAFQSALEAWA